jgi:hypothetical protein
MLWEVRVVRVNVSGCQGVLWPCGGVRQQPLMGPRLTEVYGALVEWKTEVLGELPLGPPQIPRGLLCERVRVHLSFCTIEYQRNSALHN